MKTSITRFFLLGAALAALALTSACSPQNSSAAAQPAAEPVASTPPAAPAPPAPTALEIPEVSAAPATLPPNISPTSPLASVVRLTQAGVDESIIMVYVTNSSRTFNLDSDKIIYLSDLGLPTVLMTAMMQRDQFLQQQFAAVQSAQLAQQTQQEATAPAPEPAPAETVEVTAQPAPVTATYFDETLSPYGSWVVVSGYGRCWRPTVGVYNSSWQPYCDRGHWVYSDCGWYWSSDYAWGATFHYGRWFRDTSVGWCWYPDTVWAPSWVTWRYSDSYCGWAPLPPRTYCQAGVGIVYQGGGVSLGLNFGLGASCYTFVPTQHFYNSHPRNHCASPSQAAQIYNHTTIINDIRIHGSGHNQIIVNNGIPVQNVATATQTPIRPVPVRQIDGAFTHGGHSQSTATARHGQVSGAGRANFTDNAGSPAPTVATTPQNPPHRIGNNENGNTRPAQNQFAPPVNNPAPQAQPAQRSSATVRTQPERTRPIATVPQHPASSPADRAPNNVATTPAPAANFNANPQPAPVRRQQPEASHSNSRDYDSRQNISAQNQIVAPPVNHATPPQAQPAPQPTRNYSQPRNAVRQNYSPPPIVAAPAPQPQAQDNGRSRSQNWTVR